LKTEIFKNNYVSLNINKHLLSNNKLKIELYDILSEKTGQTFDKIKTDSDRDYWMTSTEAKEYGMIDEVLLKRTN
jgi:ATP-dependent Clp protease protease subunit